MDEIIIEDFVFEKKKYCLNKPLVLKKSKEDDAVYYYFTDLNISVDETEEDAVKAAFYEQFAIMYQFYAKMNDKYLPEGAKMIKEKLLELVKEVRRA